MAKFLPAGDIECVGEWDDALKLQSGDQTYPERPVLGLFTTGTSAGETKLVLYSKANIRASLAGVLKFYDLRQISAIFSYPQPFHTFGLLLGYVLSLEKGWPLFFGDGSYSLSHHARWFEVQREYPGLMTLGTPTHFKDLMTYAATAGKLLNPTYTCIVGGASVAVKLWQDLKDRLRIQAPSIGYGATEASPGVMHQFAGRAPLQDGEIGVPLDGLKLSICKAGGYEIAGPSVCLAMIFKDRIEFPQTVHIADQIERRGDGVFLFRGRSDSVLNRGGEKFSFESIEQILRQQLDLDVLAFAVPDARLQWELGLLVRTHVEGTLDLKLALQIQKCLKSRFRAGFNVSYFRGVREFPLNQNHKLDRKMALATFSNAEV